MGGPPYPPEKKSIPRGTWHDLCFSTICANPLSIRRQRIGSRRLRHRRRQALRHRHRLGRCPRRCPRFRCTRHRTPRARRWRGWRLRSAGQSLNSCVQTRAESFGRQHFFQIFFLQKKLDGQILKKSHKID